MKWQSKLSIVLFMLVTIMLVIKMHSVSQDINNIVQEKLALEIQTINLAKRIAQIEKELEPMLLSPIGREIIPIGK